MVPSPLPANRQALQMERLVNEVILDFSIAVSAFSALTGSHHFGYRKCCISVYSTKSVSTITFHQYKKNNGIVWL